MPLCDLHTLIIPTFNRPEMLGALLRHLGASPLNVLVLDSGDRAPAVVPGQSEHPAFRVHVRRSSGTTYFYSKILEALREVQTPFVSMCPDDDILFPDALASCVRALEADASAIAAHGVYLAFDYEFEHPHRITIGSGWELGSVNGAAAETRLTQLYDLYQPNFYAVFRTDVLRDIYAFLANSTIRDYHYAECFQASASVLRGKVLRIPEIYCARREGPPADPTSSDVRRMRSMDWIKTDFLSYLSDYPAYRQLTLDWWSRCGGSDSAAQRGRCVDAAHIAFLAREFKDVTLERSAAARAAGLPLPHLLSAEVFARRDEAMQAHASASRASLARRLVRKAGRLLGRIAARLEKIGNGQTQSQADREAAILEETGRALASLNIRFKDEFKFAALHAGIQEAARTIRRYVENLESLRQSRAS